MAYSEAATNDAFLAPNVTSAPPAWQVRGDTGRLVTCLVEPGRAPLWTVQVVRADEPCLWEIYPDRPSAMRRADHLREALVGQGWINVPVDRLLGA